MAKGIVEMLFINHLKTRQSNLTEESILYCNRKEKFVRAEKAPILYTKLL